MGKGVEQPKGREPSNPQTSPVAKSPPGTLDLTGHTLADFKILRKLGQGGMGQVYLAEQISLRRHVALKILRPELAASPEALARFKLEAEAVARVTHANIVQVYACGEAEGMPYMALEYVEGRTLRNYVEKKGPPDLLVALSIMRQVAAALQRASELGIIHRDIKPENILLTRKGEVKVADFGLSRCLEAEQPALNLTQTGVTMGTPLYMSPEQVEGKPLNWRTDIYSFGVTCYHMLAGQPPFRGETAFEVALQHVRTEPAPLGTIRPDLPEGVCSVVHRMMAKDPAQRYQTGRELLRDVIRVREGLSGQTMLVAQPTMVAEALPGFPPPSNPSAPVAPLVRRRRGWLVAGALATILLALGGGVLYAWLERRDDGPMPGGRALSAADASTVESIPRPSQEETKLRDATERYLGQKPGSANLENGFGVCLDLGMLYLENNRLDQAEQLFNRLAQFDRPPSYHVLGTLGRGVVLALQNKPRESNALFTRAFLKVIPPRMKGMGKRIDKGLLPDPQVQLMMRNEKWRYWMTRARWYNRENGLADKEQPRWMIFNLPLRPDERPPVGKGGKKG